MPKRNELDTNILHILQCFLEDSKKKKFGWYYYYYLKPTDFSFPKEIKIAAFKTFLPVAAGTRY